MYNIDNERLRCEELRRNLQWLGEIKWWLKGNFYAAEQIDGHRLDDFEVTHLGAIELAYNLLKKTHEQKVNELLKKTGEN